MQAFVFLFMGAVAGIFLNWEQKDGNYSQQKEKNNQLKFLLSSEDSYKTNQTLNSVYLPRVINC